MLSNVNSVLEVDYAIQSRNMIMKHMAPVMGWWASGFIL